MNAPLNAFTVDLEDWFQGLTSTNPLVEQWPRFESRVVPATRKLLAILRSHRVKATFFVLGYVADHHPALIEEVAADGHELGVHGYWHRFVSRMTPTEFAAELELGMAAVERVYGQRPRGHRAPYFSINASTPWAYACMETAGLAYDSSVFPTRNMLYGFPGAPRFPYRVPGTKLIEFPASTVKFAGRPWPVAGGFYVRSLPYAVTRRALASIQAEGQPAVMYIHPWELDVDQHYRAVTPRERVTHYAGRRGLAHKLERLLTDFRFTTLGDLLVQCESADQVHESTPAIASPGAHTGKSEMVTHAYP